MKRSDYKFFGWIVIIGIVAGLTAPLYERWCYSPLSAWLLAIATGFALLLLWGIYVWIAVTLEEKRRK